MGRSLVEGGRGGETAVCVVVCTDDSTGSRFLGTIRR